MGDGRWEVWVCLMKALFSARAGKTVFFPRLAWKGALLFFFLGGEYSLFFFSLRSLLSLCSLFLFSYSYSSLTLLLSSLLSVTMCDGGVTM